ncbi:hypothetical protein BDQ17DRAFT_1430466 [Cyathus striatus]|nr:hypothetical protein BDQ17DRAFT_1430466 [Cyathus striatus]
MSEFAASNNNSPEDSAALQAINPTSTADEGVVSVKFDISYSPQETNSSSSEDTGVINTQDDVSNSTQASNESDTCSLTPGIAKDNSRSYIDKDNLLPERTLESMLSPEIYSNEKLMCEIMTKLLQQSSTIHEAEDADIGCPTITDDFAGADQDKPTYRVLNLYTAMTSSEMFKTPQMMAKHAINLINIGGFTKYPVKLCIHIYADVCPGYLKLSEYTSIQSIINDLQVPYRMAIELPQNWEHLPMVNAERMAKSGTFDVSLMSHIGGTNIWHASPEFYEGKLGLLHMHGSFVQQEEVSVIRVADDGLCHEN